MNKNENLYLDDYLVEEILLENSYENDNYDPENVLFIQNEIYNMLNNNENINKNNDKNNDKNNNNNNIKIEKVKKERKPKEKKEKNIIEQNENLNECSICINEIKNSCKEFKCFGCKNNYCTTCMKTYLIGTSEEPHCLNCRNVISYNYFIEKFEKGWRLNEYKKHKEKVLWDKEMAQMPSTVGYLNLLEKKKDYYIEWKKYWNQYSNIYSLFQRRLIPNRDKEEYENRMNESYKLYKEYDIKYNEVLEQLDEKKKKVIRYKWTQKCLTENCNGFLDENYHCILCKKDYCKDCLIELNNSNKKDHVCDESLKETIRMIRKESKPCPKCNEFISKISGCDQMFCTTCGTAFSWKSGQIEKGVIHNPHAHEFFQNNPDAYNEYMNLRNGDNACRDLVPPYIFVPKISYQEKQNIGLYKIERMEEVRRNISEYIQYQREHNEQKMLENENNQDIRIKFLQKELDEKKFKMLIHMRYKKNSFIKLVHENIVSTLLIIANLLWNIQNSTTKDEFIRIYNMIEEIRSSANHTLSDLCDKHNYSNSKFRMDDFCKIHPSYL